MLKAAAARGEPAEIEAVRRSAFCTPKQWGRPGGLPRDRAAAHRLGLQRAPAASGIREATPLSTTTAATHLGRRRRMMSRGLVAAGSGDDGEGRLAGEATASRVRRTDGEGEAWQTGSTRRGKRPGCPEQPAPRSRPVGAPTRPRRGSNTAARPTPVRMRQSGPAHGSKIRASSRARTPTWRTRGSTERGQRPARRPRVA